MVVDVQKERLQLGGRTAFSRAAGRRDGPSSGGLVFSGIGSIVLLGSL